jgi:hypothetical protein
MDNAPYLPAEISSLRIFLHEYCNSYIADSRSADRLARSDPARFSAHKGLARSNSLSYGPARPLRIFLQEGFQHNHWRQTWLYEF